MKRMDSTSDNFKRNDGLLKDSKKKRKNTSDISSFKNPIIDYKTSLNGELEKQLHIKKKIESNNNEENLNKYHRKISTQAFSDNYDNLAEIKILNMSKT